MRGAADRAPPHARARAGSVGSAGLGGSAGSGLKIARSRRTCCARTFASPPRRELEPPSRRFAWALDTARPSCGAVVLVAELERGAPRWCACVLSAPLDCATRALARTPNVDPKIASVRVDCCCAATAARGSRPRACGELTRSRAVELPVDPGWRARVCPPRSPAE